MPVPLDIIDEAKIESLLLSTRDSARDPLRIRDILLNARRRATLKHVSRSKLGSSEYVQGLTLEEAATLLNIDGKRDRSLLDELFATALDVKYQIYGNRIVMFAPLYIANYCVNQCTYCAFRSKNKDMPRSMLTMDELESEAEALERIGHRRLLLLTGEHPKYSFERFLEAVRRVAAVKTEPCGDIRRINVEIPSLSVSDMRRLKDTGCIGTYTLFQETYHRETFQKVHPSGPKSDYAHRLTTMDRAQIGGIDDVGIGTLFGLHDYRFEVLSMMMHADHLERSYGAGPHTISIPRMQPALNAPDAMRPRAPVSDLDFLKLTAIIRCAVPYTGMILSTRESPLMREALLSLGISQMSAGSRTDVGAYHRGDPSQDRAAFVSTVGDQGEEGAEEKEAAITAPTTSQNTENSCSSGASMPRSGEGAIEQVLRAEAAAEVEAGEQHDFFLDGQFSLQDKRSLDEVVRDLMKQGFVPSWCTACYRKGRTGSKFMSLAKEGRIQDFCHPNALLTLEEYLQDYASPETTEAGRALIAREQQNMSKPAKEAFLRKLRRVTEGERDLYF